MPTTDTSRVASDRDDHDGGPTAEVRLPHRWQRVYARQLACLDAAAVICAVSIALIIRFGESVDSSVGIGGGRGQDVTYLTAAVLLCLLWSLSLFIHKSYDERIIGGGAEEYRRVFRGSAWLWASVAIAAYVT